MPRRAVNHSQVQPPDPGGILLGMANSQTSDNSTQRFARGQSAAERLGNVSFPLAVRGYDRRAVDDFVQEVRAVVAELESTQTREGVVQRALDELGEETAGILQRAHETADEIAARSRAQADGRLQRAEREAEIVRREADEYAQQVVVDTRLLWEERQRLIEDIRQLADEVLATADDAMERVKMPEPLAIGDEAAEPPTTGELSAVPIPLPEEADAETDPDATQPYAVMGEEETEAAPVDRFAETDEQEAFDPFGEPPEGPAEPEEESGHTVELEALPGGAGTEEPPEHEPRHD
jgi:DivIVA domain-containing protein